MVDKDTMNLLEWLRKRLEEADTETGRGTRPRPHFLSPIR